MTEFLTLLSPQQAWDKLTERLTSKLGTDTIPSLEALDRVTACPILAPHSLPSFPRSAMDGYAVRALDTHGASTSLPAFFKVIGEVSMGAKTDYQLSQGVAVLIHTGGMLPDGCDAVVMLEYTQQIRPGEIEVLRPVAVGENILKEGEDVLKDQEVIPVGTRLRPEEIGGLMALGINQVSVVKQPFVAILSTGDEVISPNELLKPGQVRDVNSYTIGGIVIQSGGFPKYYGIIPDDPKKLFDVAEKALKECDVVIICAGSSASARDITSRVINQLGKPGVLVHGINIRPGKPTILSICNSKPVLGLPGNPVSALIIAKLFVTPLIHTLLGQRKSITPRVNAQITTNVSSSAGRVDWVPVFLSKDEQGYKAQPIFLKSNYIFNLVRSNGLLCIPSDTTGISAGEMVDIFIM